MSDTHVIIGCYGGFDRGISKDQWALFSEQIAASPSPSPTLGLPADENVPQCISSCVERVRHSDALPKIGTAAFDLFVRRRQPTTGERTASQMRARWIFASGAKHGTRTIRFGRSDGIYIQRQLAPRLRERGGQLSSSTSIHHVSIKEINKRKTKQNETDGLPHR